MLAVWATSRSSWANCMNFLHLSRSNVRKGRGTLGISIMNPMKLSGHTKTGSWRSHLGDSQCFFAQANCFFSTLSNIKWIEAQHFRIFSPGIGNHLRHTVLCSTPRHWQTHPSQVCPAQRQPLELRLVDLSEQRGCAFCLEASRCLGS